MASSGVNVKMGVSGVAQFKQNIQQAKNSLKTLDEQLKLNEKEFKSTGDAQTYMQTKAELLKVKQEEQKAVLANAEKALQDMTDRGVNRASKAFQDMQRQVLQAKGDILDTENAMNGVSDSSESAADGVSEMNAQLKRVGDGVSWQNIHEGLASINQGIKGVIQKAWQMGEALVRSTLGAGAWADELSQTAAQYGIDEETLQRMRKTANLIDTDVDTILNAQQKMSQGIGKRDKEAMGAFAALLGEGYDPTKKAAVDAFWDVGEALMNLDDEYDKQVYAQKLFGKSWKELVPLFKTGRDEYNKTMDSWSVVEKDQIDNLGKMDDAYQKMQGEWETFKMEMLSAFSGPLTEGMETITGLFKELNEYLDTPEGQAMLAQIGETVSSLITDLTEINPEEVVGGVKSVIDGITNSLKWIDEHQNDVKTALGVIGGAFVLLKTAEVATNIGRIVNGFQTLWGGANNKLPSVPGAPTNGGSPTGTGGSPTGTGVGTGVGTTTGGFWAMNGLSALAPLAVFVAGVAPAVIAQTQNERNWAEEKERRLETADKLTGADAAFMTGSAEVMDQIHQWTDDPLQLLMGLQNRGTIEKAKLFNMLVGQSSMGNYATNELLDLWKTGGEGWDQARLTSLLDVISGSYERMVQETGDVTGATEENTKATKEMTDAAKALESLPEDVRKGLSGMTIEVDGQTLGRVVLPYVNAGLGEYVH